MTNTEIITALVVYILSMAAALIFSITGKNRSIKVIKGALLIHLSLSVLFLITNLIESPLKHNAFLFFFCSGILCGGLIIRSSLSKIYKIYGSLYIISVFYFLLSPSGLVRLITFNPQKTVGSSFRLEMNYFLEQERSLLQAEDADVTYKVTREYGMFHKTIERGLQFGHRLDSIHVLTFISDEMANIRGYFTVKSPTFEKPDSVDLKINLKPAEGKIIQKRNKQI